MLLPFQLYLVYILAYVILAFSSSSTSLLCLYLHCLKLLNCILLKVDFMDVWAIPITIDALDVLPYHIFINFLGHQLVSAVQYFTCSV